MTLLDVSNPLVGFNFVIILAFLGLSGTFFICFSGFVKFSVILNIIKNAIGTQQIPPTIVINVLAGLMALYVIYPAIEPGLERLKPMFGIEASSDLKNIHSFSSRLQAQEQTGSMFDVARDPFKYFPELLQRAKSKTHELQELVTMPINFEKNNFSYFIGSLIHDIYHGFELGLKLYLVFVTIDFLVAIILNGCGMSMLSPTVISIPIKLSVFYLSNSWSILFKALV